MNWKRFRKPVAIIAALSLVIGLFPAYAVADSVDGGVGGAVAMDVANDKDVVNDEGIVNDEGVANDKDLVNDKDVDKDADSAKDDISKPAAETTTVDPPAATDAPAADKQTTQGSGNDGDNDSVTTPTTRKSAVEGKLKTALRGEATATHAFSVYNQDARGTVTLVGVDDPSSIAEGTEFTVKVEPKGGWQIQTIEFREIVSNSNVPRLSYTETADGYKITMPEHDAYVNVKYEPVEGTQLYRISFDRGGNDHIYGGANYYSYERPEGDHVVLQPGADSTYLITSVTAKNNTTGADIELSGPYNTEFDMPASDVTVYLAGEPTTRNDMGLGHVGNGSIKATFSDGWGNGHSSTDGNNTALVGWTVDLVAEADEGNHFVGWFPGTWGDSSFVEGYTGEALSTDPNWSFKITEDSPSAICAVFAEGASTTHTVTFDTNGASTATPAKQQVENGGYATKPSNPEKENLHFLGWFVKEPADLTKADISGSNWGGFNFANTPITDDLTLHAAWYADFNGNSYDITDPDNPVRSVSYSKGGSIIWTSSYQSPSSPTTQWYSYSTIQESEVTIKAQPFEGYEFVCWALNAKPAANEILSTKAEYTFTFGGEMTIYGLFQKATHTVSFDTGEGDTVQPQTVAHGGYATAPDRVKWGNYNTMGWHTAADPDTSFDFSNTPIMGDVVLYPNWVLSTSAHAMNKDANYSMGGGTVKRTSDSLVPAMPGGPGTTALTLSAPGSTVSFEAEAAEGFEFVGWTAGTSPTGAIISTEKTLSFTAESTSPTQLFALFQEKTNPTFTVECSINSGNVSDAISSVTVNGTALTLSEPDDGLIRPNPTVQGKVDIAPGEDVTVVIAPTDNYTVLGYSFTNISEYTGNMAPDGTTTITFKMPEENAGVSASLARAASVEYDANGGTPTLADWPADNMVKLPMSIASTGTPIDADYFSGLVTPPTGLVFAGLEVIHDGGTSTVDPGDTLSKAKFANGGKIKWLWGGGKTVTFDANGGGGTMDPAQVAEDAEYKLPECTFTAPDASTQAFDKWSVKIGDADAVEKNPGDTIKVSDDTVVTATWKDIVDVFVFALPEEAVSSVTANGQPMEDADGGYFVRLEPGASPTIVVTPASGSIVQAIVTPEGLNADTVIDTTTGGVSISAENLEKGTYIFYVMLDDAVTVTFDANATGATAPAAQVIAKGGKATKPADPTRENSPFHFMYWCADADCEGDYIDFATQTFDEDTTLYAAWGTGFAARAYDRTNKREEAGGTVKVKNEEYGVSSAASGIEGSTFTVKAKPDEGYMFVGWVEGNDPRGTIVNAGNDTYTVENYDGSIGIVYAVFAETVTVTFDPNGGTIDGSPDKVKQVIEKGGKATEPDNAVKEGFEEPGWFKDGIGDEIDLGNATFVEDTELVARWRGRIKAWVYGVTEGERYKGGHMLITSFDGAIWDMSLSINEGESTTLTAVPKDGYRFSGWAESEDGEVIKPEVDFVIESYDGSVTRLVALFVKVADITYDVNGGTKGADWKDGEIVDVGTNLSKVLGDTVPDSVPENVAKAPEGKAFCGYRIKTDADEQDLLSGKPINVEITGATTVTYLWRDPTVTIHWSSMDDVDKMDPIVIEGVPVGSTVAEALAKIGGADRVDELFAKDGYKALGWLTSEPITKFSDYDALGGAEVKGSAVVEGDMDLYYGMLTEIDGTAEATIEVPVCGTEVTTPGGDRNKQTNAPQISTPDGVNYSPDTAKGYLPAWWMVSAAEPYTPFEGTIKGGQAYYAGIWLAADYGYVFASDNIAVDGAEVIEPWSELDGRFVGAAVSVEAEHEWGEWTVVKEATEEADGLEQRTCKHCDAAEEKVIPKIVVEYRCVAGDGSSLTFGSGETLSFIFKRNVNDEATFSHFTGISIDGTVLDKSNYTAKPGSVIVTLEPSFANTLSVGDHTIVAMFDDGNDATAEFTVIPVEEESADITASDESTTSPKTGDTLPAGVVGLIAIAAAAVLAFAWRKRMA